MEGGIIINFIDIIIVIEVYNSWSPVLIHKAHPHF